MIVHLLQTAGLFEPKLKIDKELSTAYEESIFNHCLLSITFNEDKKSCTLKEFDNIISSLLFAHNITMIQVRKDNGQSFTTKVYKNNRN